MNKPELAAAIAARTGLSKAAANQLLSCMLDQIATALNRGEAVHIPGFGSFERRQRAARTGKNPRSGEPLQIAASCSVGFRPGKALREAVALSR